MARQIGDRRAQGSGRFTGSAVLAPDDPGQSPGGAATDVRTRATYRLLLMRGLDASEAANLTAYLCGIGTDGIHWSIAEVNRVLFLRRLARVGRWGAGDGDSPKSDPHGELPARAA